MLKIASKTCQQQLYNYTLVFKRITGRKHCWKSLSMSGSSTNAHPSARTWGEQWQPLKSRSCREMQARFGHLCFPFPNKVMIHCQCIHLHKEIPLNIGHQDCRKGLTVLLQEEMKTQECLKNLSSLHIQGLSEHCSTVPNPTHMYLWIATVKTKWTPLERVYNIILFTMKLTIL
jgi:hypothetical protein